MDLPPSPLVGLLPAFSHPRLPNLGDDVASTILAGSRDPPSSPFTLGGASFFVDGPALVDGSAERLVLSSSPLGSVTVQRSGLVAEPVSLAANSTPIEGTSPNLCPSSDPLKLNMN